jgi:hypothetical protein
MPNFVLARWARPSMVFSYAHSSWQVLSGMISHCPSPTDSSLTHHCRFYGDNNSADRLHDARNTCFGGLGIGLLVAAAAASASSLENFVSARREAVRLAFRLGIVVGEVSRNLHSPSPDDEGGAPDSWAYVVPEVSVENVQAELDAFHHA